MSQRLFGESIVISGYMELQVRLAWIKIESGDPKVASDWLHHHLGMVAHQDVSGNVEPHVGWVLLQLDLAVFLLQVAEIPIFLPARLDPTNNGQSESGRQLHVRFPWIDGIPVRALSLALQASLELLHRMHIASFPLSSLEVYDWITEHVIQTILPYAAPVKSTIHLLRCAFEHNVPFFHYGRGMFLLGTGSRSRLISGSSSECDSMISALAAQDKCLTHQILTAAGLPVPAQRRALGLEAVLAAAREMSWPLVLKPINRDRGEGVTINIRSDEELAAAATSVFRLTGTREVILEEMQPGRCHRLVIVNRQLVYALIRLPVAVVGDGCSTVRQLILKAHQANMERPPWIRSGNQYLCDQFTETVLAESGYSYTSVPCEGDVVNLRLIESTEWGGRDEDLTAVVHPDNLALAIAAADALRLSIAGVDLMSTDLTVPWHRNGATINEVNAAPLIGGGQTSRSHLPRFLHCLLGTDPMIPIQRFDQRRFSLQQARAFQVVKRRQGVRAFILSADGCFDDDGRRIQTNLAIGRPQLRALLTNPNVDELIVID